MNVSIWGRTGYPDTCVFNITQFHLNINNNALGITDYTQETATTAIAKFKSFLADQYANGTPVIVVYPLATPTTETVTAQPMNIQKGTNIIEVTEASLDDLEIEVKYKGK